MLGSVPAASFIFLLVIPLPLDWLCFVITSPVGNAARVKVSAEIARGRCEAENDLEVDSQLLGCQAAVGAT